VTANYVVKQSQWYKTILYRRYLMITHIFLRMLTR